MHFASDDDSAGSSSAIYRHYIAAASARCYYHARLISLAAFRTHHVSSEALDGRQRRYWHFWAARGGLILSGPISPHLRIIDAIRPLITRRRRRRLIRHLRKMALSAITDAC